VRARYADRLRARYKLDDITAVSDQDLLAELGRKRGGLRAGGQVDLQKAAEIAINDFRSGAWGRITLETPEEFAQWLAAGHVREAERQAKAAARARKRPPQRGEDAEAAANPNLARD
jgi:ribosome biogenesis GTPase A